MLKCFITTGHDLQPTSRIEQAGWLLLSAPGPGDILALESVGIPLSLLEHVRDPNERPRVVQQNGSTLIVLHFPWREAPDAPTPFMSMPLGIILSPGRIITATPHRSDFVERVLASDVRELATETQAQFVLRLMIQVADEYLKGLDTINSAVEELESALKHSLRNREVLELLKYEKSLVYFTTSLTSNELLLQRLQKGEYLEWSEADRRIVDEVMIEVHQAMEMVNIAQNILSQMMDAFASIVSNNLNAVMKFLTSATIIVSIPTLIASLYGMNVRLPGASDPMAFTWIATGSLLMMLVLVVIFIRKHWF